MALFGKRNAKKAPSTCLLLARDSSLLARGEIKSRPEDPNIQVRLTSGEPEKVHAAEIVQIIPTNQSQPPQMGRVLLIHGEMVVMQPMRDLGEKVRQNFRMPMDFESYVYPKGGGRAFIKAADLSCGGIAMYSAYPLDVGEVCEVVIPVTSEGPLILNCEILRSMPCEGPVTRYAAKFVDLIHDQESALREAVFQTQVQEMQTRKRKN